MTKGTIGTICRFCNNKTYSRIMICQKCQKKNKGIGYGSKMGLSRLYGSRKKYGYGMK